MKEDIRWIQRFNNYMNAFRELEEGVDIAKTRALSKLEKQGLIQGFEYTHELAWNLLKDYLTEQGIVGLIGSKDCTREAFKNGLVSSGEIWMDMIQARNLTSHTYDTQLAEKVYQSIIEGYYPRFVELKNKFSALLEKQQP
ncbi:MAG TPA: nucleotidyltransferase [Spirochaetia bacterium]|nr:MAG: nucleotidyltransferase [Spirochaetes bacterium GWB1_36_13]HCL55963.1 nucleotidyltransferase [Spirochaetia bacterium]